MHTKFDSKAIAKLGCYVYALYDPVDQRVPFYVGKGQGNRVFAHAEARYGEILDEDELSMKNKIIDDIRNRPPGQNKVVHRLIAYGLRKEDAVPGEKVAFAIEAALIQVLKQIDAGFGANEAAHQRKMGGNVVNSIEGHGEKMEDARDLAMRLNAEPLTNTDGVCCIAFKINTAWGLWKRSGKALADITRQEYWDAVRGHWPVVGHGHNVMLVVGDQIVREVFFVEQWKDSIDKRKGLREMVGDPGDQRAEPYRQQFVGRSVTHLFSNPQSRLLYLPLRRPHAAKSPSGPNGKSKRTAG